MRERIFFLVHCETHRHTHGWKEEIGEDGDGDGGDDGGFFYIEKRERKRKK